MRLARASAEAARHAALSAKQKATEARDRVGESISDRPFTSVAIAAGVGAAVMALVLMLRKR